MKKVLLFSLLGLLGGSVMAKKNAVKTNKPVANAAAHSFSTAHKSTGDGDTYMLSNIVTYDSLTYYTYNAGGFEEGMNTYGDKGYAERYDFDGSDSAMTVVGVMALFHGTYTANTTKTVNINVWSQGAKTLVANNFYYDGLPGTVLATQNYPITSLGIDVTQNGGDSIFTAAFTTPTQYINDSFYVGYDISYTATAMGGDTIGVYSTTNNSRTSAPGFIEGTDTVINVQNAVQWSDNSWNDEYFVNSAGQLFHDYALFPVVTIKYTTGIKGIKRNNFTLYGSYPNPATDVTNVRYSLKTSDDITITVTDLAGRIISSSTEKGLAAGEHISTINTSALATGNYIYLIRSGNGGIASQFTVAK